MLQRNTGRYPLVLPTLDPPQTVLPGDTLDHPVLLAGFEEVPAEPTAEPPVKAAAAARPAATPKSAPAEPPADPAAKEA